MLALLAAACGGTPKTAKPEVVTTPPAGHLAATVAAANATSPSPATASSTPAVTPTPSPSPTPAATPSPSPSPTASPSPRPTPSPAPIDTLTDGTHGYVVTSSAVVQAEPNTTSTVVAHLHYQQQLVLHATVRGERYVVGDQTWAMATQDWSNKWYQVDGGYVYSAWVWLPRPGEILPSQLGPGAHWIDVNLATQTARLMVGNQAVYSAGITSGKDGYETPQGNWTIQYQVLNETMTSAQAGINDPAQFYDVKHVLFTQYFDTMGDALHLNYWQPVGVFGNTRTSHGCAGLSIGDAQYFWMFGETGMQVKISRNGAITPPTQPPAPAHTAAPARTPSPAPRAVATPSPAPQLAAPSGTPATETITAPVGAPETPADAPTLAPSLAPARSTIVPSGVPRQAAPRSAPPPATQAAPSVQ